MLEVLAAPIEMATCGLVTKAVIIVTGLFLLLPPSSGVLALFTLCRLFVPTGALADG
jgi:hypothetical protein